MLREGGVHRLHREAQRAALQLLQLAQAGAEVVVGLARDVQVTQREVQPASQQPTQGPSPQGLGVSSPLALLLPPTSLTSVGLH